MKKLCALLLCVLMTVSLIPSVSAAVDVFVTDTYDNLAIGDFTGTNVSKNVLMNYDQFLLNGGTAEIVADGYIGNALKITEDGGTGFKFYSRLKTDVKAYNVFNFKIKLLNNPGSLKISTSEGNAMLYVQNGEFMGWGTNRTSFKYQLNKWYDVQIEYTGTVMTLTVSDDLGNKAFGQQNTPNNYWSLTPHTSVNGESFMIDEARLIQCDGTDALNITASSYGSSPSVKTVVANDNFDAWDGTLALRWYMAPQYNNNNWALFPYNDYATITANNCNGDVAPVIETKTAGSLNCKSKSASYETGKVYTSFQLQVVDDLRDSNNGVGKYITQLGGGDGKEYIWIRNGNIETRTPFANKTVTYNRDDWYTIVTTFEKNEDATNHLTIKVYNEAGNVVLEDEVNTSTAYDTAFYFEGVTVGGKVSFDDVKVIHEESTVSNVINGSIMDEILGRKSKENLGTTTPAVKVSFDGIVADGSTAKFVSADKEIAATVKFTGSSLVEIAPVSPLDYDTSYTLDLSGIKGLNNQGLATGSTAALSLKTPVYSVGTMAVDTPAYNGTQVTVPVTFTNENVDELNATVIAALFSGENSDKLVWAQTKNVVAGEMGDNEFTFINLPENADTMDLKIFVWDNFVSLKPLYK